MVIKPVNKHNMETEKWFKEKLGVTKNWDRSDYEMPRYSFNDMVDFAEQFKDEEVKKALKEHQKKALINLMELDQKTNKEQTKG